MTALTFTFARLSTAIFSNFGRIEAGDGWLGDASSISFAALGAPKKAGLTTQTAGDDGAFTLDKALGSVAIRGTELDGFGKTSGTSDLMTLAWTGDKAVLSLTANWLATPAAIEAFDGTALEIRGFRDVLVDLENSFGQSVTVTDATRARIETGAGNDSVTVHAHTLGAYLVDTGAGNDTITISRGLLGGVFARVDVRAGAGDDTIIGSGANDTVDGGSGVDTFVVAGQASDYRVTDLGNGAFKVEDLSLRHGMDGADMLRGIEKLRFTAGGPDINLAPIVLPPPPPPPVPVNQAPTDVVLAGSYVAENNPGTLVGILSGTDPDTGDRLTFSVSDDRFVVVGNQLRLKNGVSLDFEQGAKVDLTIRATDSGGLFTEKATTIIVGDLDESVTSNADRFSATEDTALRVDAGSGLLSNDVAGDGGLKALAGRFATAAGGTVDIAADGSFVYTPKADFFGMDSFDYTATDRNGSTATATAAIDVASGYDAPVISGIIATATPGIGSAFISFTVSVETREADAADLQIQFKVDGPTNTYAISAPGGTIISSGSLGAGAHQATIALEDTNGLVEAVVYNVQIAPDAASDLIGTGGRDILVGSRYGDHLDGGAGADVLVGGAGADSFVFSRGYGTDEIRGFSTTGGDFVSLSGLGSPLDTADEVLAAFRQVGSNAVFDAGNGDTLTLIGVSASNLRADDFMFA